jgi:hypothetical protein
MGQSLGIGHNLDAMHADEDGISFGLGSIVSYEAETRIGDEGEDDGATKKAKKIVAEVCDYRSEERTWEYWGVPSGVGPMNQVQYLIQHHTLY